MSSVSAWCLAGTCGATELGEASDWAAGALFSPILVIHGEMVQIDRVFDASGEELVDPTELVARPVLFRVAVENAAMTSGRWPIVGQVPLGPDDVRAPDAFLQDLFDPTDFRIASTSLDGAWSERRATLAECEPDRLRAAGPARLGERPPVVPSSRRRRPLPRGLDRRIRQDKRRACHRPVVRDPGEWVGCTTTVRSLQARTT